MAKIPFDVTGVVSQPPSQRMKRMSTEDVVRVEVVDKEVEAGSFAARVEARQVDLVQLIEQGLPPLEYLPASDGMLVGGKRHLIAAPAKVGKSISMLVHFVDMVLANGNVVILDRENGSDLYAKRLADIFAARKLTKKQREQVRAGLHYYEFPQLRSGDADALAEHFASADLVVFDAQRMFLSDFGLKESVSDDYAEFMSYAIDPLFRARIATLILDNTGHKEQTRGRGTAAKGDLNELLFSMDTLSEFDLYRPGRLRLKVEFSRSGTSGEWTMDIGGGHFTSWQSTVDTSSHDRDDFLDAVKAALNGRQLGADKLIKVARDKEVSIGTDHARRLLDQYVTDPSIPISKTPKGYQNDAV